MSARQAAIPDPWEQLLPLPVQAPRELYMPELPEQEQEPPELHLGSESA